MFKKSFEAFLKRLQNFSETPKVTQHTEKMKNNIFIIFRWENLQFYIYNVNY